MGEGGGGERERLRGGRERDTEKRESEGERERKTMPEQRVLRTSEQTRWEEDRNLSRRRQCAPGSQPVWQLV